jgi:Kef-type K+ transport system membrane component KefB
MVGAVAGSLVGLPLTPWVNYLAGFGAILLTFLAGTEVDIEVVRRNLGASIGIGILSFLAPYLGCLLAARYLLGWSWPESQIAGIALSTTSVAVVYAVMVETGLNKTELGKIILAACFITDLGTVLALGIVFANYSIWLAVFAAVTLIAAWLMPKVTPWFFARVGQRVSEPEIKFVLLVLFLLGGIALAVGSEAVLPAYIIGMMLAPTFQREHELAHRMRVITFATLTPFYFLKAGSLIDFKVLVSGAGMIALFLGLKMLTKFIGILPLTRVFKFEPRDGIYTTLLMSTGLTFGSISALYGLTNNIINQEQYTILLTAVIASAVVPTLIAQKWFMPKIGSAKQEV